MIIPDLWSYMDDSFGIDEYTKNVMWYPCYKKNMPANQVKLLSLWDKLGIPHEPHKQVFRDKLTIIGIEINVNSLTLTLLEQRLYHLLEELHKFTAWTKEKRGMTQTLQCWQQLVGWLNWNFNIFPMICPALNNIYAKILGRISPT